MKYVWSLNLSLKTLMMSAGRIPFWEFLRPWAPSLALRKELTAYPVWRHKHVMAAWPRHAAPFLLGLRASLGPNIFLGRLDGPKKR